MSPRAKSTDIDMRAFARRRAESDVERGDWFMSMVDSAPRGSTARVKEACELSVIDGRTSASWST